MTKKFLKNLHDKKESSAKSGVAHLPSYSEATLLSQNNSRDENSVELKKILKYLVFKTCVKVYLRNGIGYDSNVFM